MQPKDLKKTRCLVHTQARYFLKGKKMKPVPNVPVECSEVQSWMTKHPVTIHLIEENIDLFFDKDERINLLAEAKTKDKDV